MLNALTKVRFWGQSGHDWNGAVMSAATVGLALRGDADPEIVQRYFRPDSPPVHRPDSPPVQSSALVTLADLFMHRLNDGGPMSREELVALAVKEGFFADTETAAQAVHPMLVILSRSELIHELPNGTFAPPTMSQAIKVV
jgi:hypothetical protein